MSYLLLLLEIFWTFTKVALFTWGGGPASLPIMGREVVDHGWITQEEFADAVALGNSLPGPIAPQMGIYVGYKVAGVAGAMMGMLGSVVPTSIIMLALVAAFLGAKNLPWVQSILAAVRPAVVGMLLWTAYDIGSKVLDRKSEGVAAAVQANWDKFLIVVAAFVALTYFKMHPALVVIIALVFGLVVYR
ncbi:MAG TPA: chromate transporter [Anaerolineae bacterium]|nr:chromate transporter [Anaerolineae bacterium]